MHGAGLIARPAANLDLAPAGLGMQDEQCALVVDLDPAASVRGIVLVYVEADNLRAPQTASIADQQDRPVPQSAQIEGQGRDHREDILRQDRFFLHRWSRVLAPDPGKHSGDVAVLAIKSKAALLVVPGKAGQTAVDGR